MLLLNCFTTVRTETCFFPVLWLSKLFLLNFSLFIIRRPRIRFFIAIYNIMRQTEGIYGGRFSGAGFKGACIALVDPTKKDEIRQRITEEYLRMFPEYTDSFEIHFCKTDDGARFLID